MQSSDLFWYVEAWGKWYSLGPFLYSFKVTNKKVARKKGLKKNARPYGEFLTR